MIRYKKTKCFVILEFFKNLFPNGKDNLKQILIKIFFLLSVIGILLNGIYFGNYYYNLSKEQAIINDDRAIFENYDIEEANIKLHSKNYDYRAWLRLCDTQLNNPVFKSNDNSFYLSHNSFKKPSLDGSLFFDYRCSLSDKNLVIYGNSPDNGSLFASLNRLREISFYRENSLLHFTNGKRTTKYKIYAVFVLNSSKEQDGGRIYNIYRKSFSEEALFNDWVDDAKNRSVIDTGVDVSLSDNILTLVTSCDDFEGARLIVMARSQRDDEVLSNFNKDATANPNPKFPKKWYDCRNIKYPF